MQTKRSQAINDAWKQLNLATIPENKYAVDVFDMTQDRLISQTGRLFPALPDTVFRYNEVTEFAVKNMVYSQDSEGCIGFSDRQRILDMFENGKREDSFEYRTLQQGNSYRWTVLHLQVICDPYSGHVMAQLLFRDIDDEKKGLVKMERSMEALKSELEQSKIKVLINQMQPHFLYNALSAIQTIVKVDPDYAYQLIYDFTTHLRASIKALQSDAPVPFADEMENVKAYLNIEKMRMGDRLNIVYDIQSDSFSVIPLTIQPLAENAARHGIYSLGSKGGTLTIKSYETNVVHVVEVIDDGKGFDVDTVLNSNSDSVGLKNLIFRLKTMMNADIEIMSKESVGTRVIVTIPKEGGNAE